VDLRHAQINSVGIRQGRGHMPSKNPLGIALGCNDLRCFWLMYSARQLSANDSSCSGTLSLSSKSHFRSRALVHRAYSANASLASSSFNLAIRARTRLLSSASAIASDGSPHMSSPAVVLVARQSKFGSFSISIRPSVSFDRQALADCMVWLLTLCCPKTPQLELRSLIQFSVFLNREATIWNPVRPVLDRAAQPRGGGVEFGIATK
jgi:hypothetical protein